METVRYRGQTSRNLAQLSNFRNSSEEEELEQPSMYKFPGNNNENSLELKYFRPLTEETTGVE